jgi:hypothetical protein
MKRLASSLLVVVLVVSVVAVALPDGTPRAEAIGVGDSVGLVDVTTGIWYLRDPYTGATTSFYYGNPGDYPIMGDWDCDGVDTPGLYRQSDGYVYLRNSNTQGVADIRFFFGNPSDIPLAGDFNGNGCDTVSIYRPSEGRAFIINQLGANDGGLGAAEFSYYFGNPGDKPFAGDFNADGIDTVGLHRESSGFVYFRNTHTQGIADFQFFYGDPGDRIVAGRWANGTNPADTVGIYRPSQGTFYLRYSNTQGNADEQFTFGNANMRPVAGYFGTLPGGSPPPPGTPTTPPVPGDFAPFVLSGTGDDVRSLTVPNDARAILDISYVGSSNFIVWSYDGSGPIDLTVNEIGSYSGRRPINFPDGGGPVRQLEITAEGSWTIEVLPVSRASTQLSGNGDNVVRVIPTGSARPVTFTHNGSSNFIVWSYSATNRLDLEVNTIGSYSGTVLLDAWSEFLEIQADGAWTITFD